MYMFSRNILYNIRKQSMEKEFMSFEEFKESLGSWQDALKNFLNAKTYQDIYKYVKAEVQAGKKVH